MTLNRTLDNLNTNLRLAARRISLGGHLDPSMTSSALARDIHPVGNEIALVNCSIFDGLNPGIKEHMTLLVEDGKIFDVGHRNKIPIPDGCHVVDARGRTMMPGLILRH